MRYATNTSVSVEKSRAEIESVLRRYGATGFGYMARSDKAMIGFEWNFKAVKFVLPLPHPSEPKYWTTPQRRNKRSPEEASKLWEQDCRTSWRALLLCIKAKLEACEAGITTFEHEFMAHFVMKDGQTFGEKMLPQIEEHYKSGKMPKLLGIE